MKIVILHHHLRGGGVTRIIESQIKSLLLLGMKKDDIAVLSGFTPSETKIPGVLYITEPELDYLFRDDAESQNLGKSLEKISQIVRSVITMKDVLHIHNYGLGKNPLVTYAVYQMIEDGYRVINHCHDFAEDRPDTMAFLEGIVTGHFGVAVKDVLYPVKENLLFGVINRVDQARLQESGVPAESIYYMPNPVDPVEFSSALKNKVALKKTLHDRLAISVDKKMVTYPVRVIRRKNIQEVLLLAILYQEDVVFAVTLTPDNPVEVEYYHYWKRFSERNRLPVIFDVANKVDFRELIAASDFCITTSFREGFGMTFLEPWLTDTPVVGRDIPAVTCDFRDAGVVLSGFYGAIKVKSYSNKDFKDLSREECTTVFVDLKKSSSKRDEIFSNNPPLRKLFTSVDKKTIQENRRIITEKYSLLNYGRLLNEIYKRLPE